MQPTGAGGETALKEKLVVGQVATDVIIKMTRVGQGLTMDVGRLTTKVLGIGHTTHQLIETGTTITTGDNHRTDMSTQRLKHPLTQQTKTGHLTRTGGVVDAHALSQIGTRHLTIGEMGREILVHSASSVCSNSRVYRSM